MAKLIPISLMPLDARHWYILAAASMEQLIGAALSTVVGIMIPLILMAGSPALNAFEQGVMGSAGLIGIAIGSMLIGRLMDAYGYLLWFRLCPIIIAAASAAVFFIHDFWPMFFFLFLIGVGVGGGYSLDSGYVSEIMPTRWVSFFVGLAKATCSLGFIGGAAAGFFILKADPSAQAWPYLIIFIGALGVITLLMRIRWHQSPRWLMEKKETEKAQKAAKGFFGPDAEVLPEPSHAPAGNVSWASMFAGKNLDKVILSGVTWACEGLGVYGFGVFLPILVISLGMRPESAAGLPKIMDSVQTTIFINLFIAAGFATGLAILHKVNIFRLMGWGFCLCGISLAILLGAYALKWPVWISFLCFVVFETALNAGPHLVTYIVPAKIYAVEVRGAGTGIATMMGKAGAVLGVFFMPLLLSWGGVALVLWVSIAVQFIGAVVTFIYSKKLRLA